MTGPVSEKDAFQALVRAYVACQLALDALPDLPVEVRRPAEQPIQALCQAIGPALERHHPGFIERERHERTG